MFRIPSDSGFETVVRIIFFPHTAETGEATEAAKTSEN